MKKTLILDTSTERAFFAFSEDKMILKTVLLPFGLQHSNVLIPSLFEEVQKFGIEIADLSFIGCGMGPGSYTGMRVGASVAKTLSYATEVPLYGVSSLSAFVPVNLSEGEHFISLIDAKIGGVYLQEGEFLGEDGYRFNEPRLCSIEELKSFEVNQIATPNKKRLEPLFLELGLMLDAKWHEVEPSPAVFLQEAMNHPKIPFELQYLRKTQAEIEREC